MIEAVETYPRLAEAAAALARGGARFMAGGTVAMRDANYGRFGAPRLVRTTDPAFRALSAQGDRIEIGAGATLAQVLESRELAALHPVARLVGGPAVREAATVGGNLFAPHPYGDFAAALLALGAVARLAEGREMPLADLFAQRDRVGLVASLSLQRPRRGEFGFRKLSRVKPKGVSVLSVAVKAPGAPSRVSGAAIAFAGMGPHPLRAAAAERALEGARRDHAGVAAACAAAAEGLSPPDDPLASAWYRAEVAGVQLRRCLLEDMA
ncbi:MAG: FAD binding domain-containing protein [Pseudomonadota bacterium]